MLSHSVVVEIPEKTSKRKVTLMKNRQIKILVAVVSLVGVVVEAVAIVECMNAAGYHHDANAVCMNCQQWTAINTGQACTAHIYSANVTWNCYRGKAPAIAVFPGGYGNQTCIEANVTVQIRSGVCTGGGCIGTDGAATPDGYKCLWTSTQCFVGG